MSSKKIVKKSIYGTFILFSVIISCVSIFNYGFDQQFIIYFSLLILSIILFYFLELKDIIKEAKDNNLNITVQPNNQLIVGLLCVSLYFNIIELDSGMVKLLILFCGIICLVMFFYNQFFIKK